MDCSMRLMLQCYLRYLPSGWRSRRQMRLLFITTKFARVITYMFEIYNIPFTNTMSFLRLYSEFSSSSAYRSSHPRRDEYPECQLLKAFLSCLLLLYSLDSQEPLETLGIAAVIIKEWRRKEQWSVFVTINCKRAPVFASRPVTRHANGRWRCIERMLRSTRGAEAVRARIGRRAYSAKGSAWIRYRIRYGALEGFLELRTRGNTLTDVECGLVLSCFDSYKDGVPFCADDVACMVIHHLLTSFSDGLASCVPD